jgi:hypothetical protein
MLVRRVGLELNVEKTKYLLVSRHQNADRNQDIKKKETVCLKLCHSSNIWVTVITKKFIREENDFW